MFSSVHSCSTPYLARSLFRDLFWFLCTQHLNTLVRWQVQGLVSVLFVGCLVVAVHGWFVCVFVGAMVYVVRGDVWPMMLSQYNKLFTEQATWMRFPPIATDRTCNSGSARDVPVWDGLLVSV